MISKLFSGISRRTAVAVSVLGSLVLSGCNGVGGKDALLARIDDEKIYQEDVDLLVKNDGLPRGISKGQYLYDQIYSKAAIVATALTEYPELEKEWEEYHKDLEPRILTMVYQRYYSTECLMYSDSELRQFYKDNQALFSGDSSKDFLELRGDIAKKLYVSKHKAEVEKFIAEALAGASEPTAKDTLELKDRFAESYRQRIPQEVSATILEKHKMVVNELPKADPQAYYEKHLDQYMTTPGYELLHIQGKTAGALDSLFADTPSLEQFKAVAAKSSLNPTTQKDSGFVGIVKEGHALPYGIGLVEGLPDELKGKSAGFVTKALVGQDGNFHKFYLLAQVPSKQKSFDRAASSVMASIVEGNFYEVDSNFALITKDGKPIFTEADFLRFNDKFAHVRPNVKNHERIVNMIASNLAFADEALDLKLNRSWEYRALVRKARLDYISDAYMERKRGSYLVSADSLKGLYDRIGSPIHIGYDYEKAIEDLKQVNSLPENLYKHEYLFGYRIIYAGKTYEQSIPLIYAKREKEYKNLYRSRVAAEAYAKATVHLYDTDTQEYIPSITYDVLLAQADSLVKEGKKSAAYYTYRKLTYAYAEVDSLYEKAAYEMSVLQADNEEFADAEAEYYTFYRMWPNSANAEKAMFSRGFMLNENLGLNDAAVEVLEEFLKTYPNSELKESAEWLVNNIKSDGKLAEDLMKKISSEE